MPVEFNPEMVAGVHVITLWRQRYRFVRGELHFHSCTECYEDGPCMMDCEFEPELSPDDECMRGCACICDACRLEAKARGRNLEPAPGGYQETES